MKLTENSKCEFCTAGKVYSVATTDETTVFKFDCGSNIHLSNNANMNLTIKNNLCVPINRRESGESNEIEVAFAEEDWAVARNGNFVEEKSYLVHDLVNLYQWLFKIISINQNSKKFREAVFLQAVLTSKHELIKGYLQFLRGHHIDSYANTRKAIEFSLFGARCIENIESAQKWVNASNSEKEWMTYRKDFRIYELFKLEKSWVKLKSLHPKLEILIAVYDEVSRYIHASRYSTNLDLQPKDDHTVVTFRVSHFKQLNLADTQQQFSLLLKDFTNNLDFLFHLTKFLEIVVPPEFCEERNRIHNEILEFYESLKQLSIGD